MLFSTLLFSLVLPFSSFSGLWPQVSYPVIQRSAVLKPPVIMPHLTSKQTPTPTLSPTPFPTSTPIPTFVRTSVSISTNSDAQTNYFLEQINNYRRSQGLTAVSIDSHSCSFAAIRAGEITSAFNHDGFTNRINSKTLSYPGYHYVTENIAMNSNYQDVINAWINSSGHAANMRADTPFVCVKSSGNFYAYEGWKP